MRSGAQLVAALAFSATAVASSTAFEAEDKKFEWLSPRYTACEGVGLAGTFTTHATVTFDRKGTAAVVTAIATHVSSPIIGGSSKKDIAVRVEVVKGESVLTGVSLEAPKAPAVIPEPGPNDTRAKYLPTGRSLEVPAGGALRFTVTPTITKPKGTCVLGTATNDAKLE